ncbi:uncharacterized protein J3D65DRAFT_637732 [Phyllosticta citribraziliensis]|uniref:Uncharacterized protein n=1 Tax=Phyllosticta citribraziliensis TaxID=989973 RepID=A0ABR1L8A9_9PEZI
MLAPRPMASCTITRFRNNTCTYTEKQADAFACPAVHQSHLLVTFFFFFLFLFQCLFFLPRTATAHHESLSICAAAVRRPVSPLPCLVPDLDVDANINRRHPPRPPQTIFCNWQLSFLSIPSPRPPSGLSSARSREKLRRLALVLSSQRTLLR